LNQQEDGTDDDIDNYTDGNRRSSRARGSEFSIKSKLKSSTSRA
jgi:hypothetical protein